MNQNIQRIFKNPISDNVLEFNPLQNVFIDKLLNEEFFLKDSVIKFSKNNSHYELNYQKDAEVIDYFANDTKTCFIENERSRRKTQKNIGNKKICSTIGKMTSATIPRKGVQYDFCYYQIV